MVGKSLQEFGNGWKGRQGSGLAMSSMDWQKFTKGSMGWVGENWQESTIASKYL